MRVLEVRYSPSQSFTPSTLTPIMSILHLPMVSGCFGFRHGCFWHFSIPDKLGYQYFCLGTTLFTRIPSYVYYCINTALILYRNLSEGHALVPGVELPSGTNSCKGISSFPKFWWRLNTNFQCLKTISSAVSILLMYVENVLHDLCTISCI